jgi:glycosyltransferase involved in cell wall biosynthesis
MKTALTSLAETPPPIGPVPDGVVRPRWSVMIPVFNSPAAYLRETLASVLAQDPGPAEMEIEVVDNCSNTNDPGPVVAEVGRGRVRLHRQSENVGMMNNWNTCVRRASGQLVHILHGDDLANRGFYAEMGKMAEKHPELSWFACRAFDISPTGELETLSFRMPVLEQPGRDASPFKYYCSVRAPGVVLRRDFYAQSGGFVPALIHTADWEMWVRAIAQGGGIMLNAPLVSYRVWPGSDTGSGGRLARGLRDWWRCADYLERHIPDFDRPGFAWRTAMEARKQMVNFVARGDREAAAANRALWRELAPWDRRMIWAFKDLARAVLAKLRSCGSAPNG